MKDFLLVSVFSVSSLFAADEAALSATFRLRYERHEAGASITGAGTCCAIGARKLLTASHNVRGPAGEYEQLQVEIAEVWVAAKVKRIYPDVDVALLSVEVNLPAMLCLGAVEARPGDEVTVCASLTGLPVAAYHGKLLRRWELGRAVYLAEITFNHGGSGGPVLNTAGTMVGLAVAGLPDNHGGFDDTHALFVPLAVLWTVMEGH